MKGRKKGVLYPNEKRLFLLLSAKRGIYTPPLLGGILLSFVPLNFLFCPPKLSP
nr:MAG TPA: hypothetical protein [Bacteriophage sp.]